MSSQQQPPLLALPGIAFPSVSFYNPTKENAFDIHGHVVRLSPANTEAAADSESHSVQTGRTVWDCSIVLAKWLEFQVDNHAIDLKGKRIIELGAGTGLTGIAVSFLTDATSTIVLTDVAAHVPAMERNIQLNYPQTAQHITATELDWLKPVPASFNPPVDVVLAADVVWVDELIEPLVNTMASLSGPETKLYFAYQSRSSRADSHLFSRLEQDFTWRRIPHSEHHPVYRNPSKIDIYVLQRKSTTE